MYLNPPCETLQELNERIDAGETFRVFKRRVSLNTRDMSFIRTGVSTIILSGVLVKLMIIKGTVRNGKPAFLSFENVPERLEQQAEDRIARVKVESDLSFRDLLKTSADTEARVKSTTEVKVVDNYWANIESIDEFNHHTN
jgi:hypothetical protein